MIEIRFENWVHYENGEYHVRFGDQGGWFLLENAKQNSDGTISGILDLSLLPEAPQPAPEGGSVEVGAIDSVGTEDIGPGGA